MSLIVNTPVNNIPLSISLSQRNFNQTSGKNKSIPLSSSEIISVVNYITKIASGNTRGKNIELYKDNNSDLSIITILEEDGSKIVASIDGKDNANVDIIIGDKDGNILHEITGQNGKYECDTNGIKTSVRKSNGLPENYFFISQKPIKISPQQSLDKRIKNGIVLSDGSVLVRHAILNTGKTTFEKQKDGSYKVTLIPLFGGISATPKISFISEDELLKSPITAGTIKKIAENMYEINTFKNNETTTELLTEKDAHKFIDGKVI